MHNMMKRKRRDRTWNDNLLHAMKIPADVVRKNAERDESSFKEPRLPRSVETMYETEQSGIKWDDVADNYCPMNSPTGIKRDEWNNRIEAVRKVSSRLARLDLSKKNLETVVEVSNLIYEHSISVEEIETFFKTSINQLATPRTFRYCSCCHRILSNHLSTCTNNDCSLFHVNPVRGAPSQQTVISLFSIRNQVKNVVEAQLVSILRTHIYHHEANGTSTSLASFHLSPKYREGIETREEFDKNHLKLPVSISYDGFCPKNLSKSELTPLYVRIEGVPNILKEEEDSIILAAMHMGPGGVSSKNAHLFSSRLISELEEMRMNPIKINHREEPWTIELNVVMTLTDAKAARAICGFPNWAAVDGCSDCNVVGFKNGSSVSYFTHEPLVLRTCDELRYLVRQKGKENPLSVLVSQIEQPIDELHCISEGVSKKFLTDILGQTSFWTELKLPAGVIRELDETIQRIKNNPIHRSAFVVVSRLGKLTGSQIRHTSRIVFTIIGLENVYEKPYLALFFIVLVRYLDLLFSIQDLCHIPKIVKMAGYLKNYYGSYHKETYTYKTHVLLDHAAHKVMRFGNLKGTTTAPFEKNHRTISVSYNQFSTNAEDMCRNFLLKRALAQRKDIKAKMNQVVLSNDVSVSRKFRLTPAQIRKFEPITTSTSTFWKRVYYKGKIISSESFGNKQEDNVITVVHGTDVVVGSAEVFLSNSDGVSIVLNEYEVLNPLNDVYEKVKAELGMKSAITDVARTLRNENFWVFKRSGGSRRIIVPIENYIKSLVRVHFRGSTYYLESHN